MTRLTNDNASGRQPHGGQTELAVDHLSLDQVLALGQESARALKNQSVELGLQHAVRQLQNEWAECKPEEKAKREGLYWELQGLQRFYASMNYFVTNAQALQEQQRQQQLQQEQAYSDIT